MGLDAGDYFKTGRGIQRGSCGIFQGVKGLKEGKEGVTKVSLEDRLGGVGTPSSKMLLVVFSSEFNTPALYPT